MIEIDEMIEIETYKKEIFARKIERGTNGEYEQRL
jgi:hypothetical protein